MQRDDTAYLGHVLDSARVWKATRAARPEAPWKRIAEMSHRIVHHYMNMDADILQQVVTRNLPGPIRLLKPIVPPKGV